MTKQVNKQKLEIIPYSLHHLRQMYGIKKKVLVLPKRNLQI